MSYKAPENQKNDTEIITLQRIVLIYLYIKYV